MQQLWSRTHRFQYNMLHKGNKEQSTFEYWLQKHVEDNLSTFTGNWKQPTAVLRYLSYKDNIKKINLVGEKKSQISTDITNIESRSSFLASPTFLSVKMMKPSFLGYVYDDWCIFLKNFWPWNTNILASYLLKFSPWEQRNLLLCKLVSEIFSWSTFTSISLH